MMTLQSRETHNITLKTWPYLGPNNAIPPVPDCEICELMEFSTRLKNSKLSHGIEIRSCDSIIIIIPLMIEENRAKFLAVSL